MFSKWWLIFIQNKKLIVSSRNRVFYFFFDFSFYKILNALKTEQSIEILTVVKGIAFDSAFTASTGATTFAVITSTLITNHYIPKGKMRQTKLQGWRYMITFLYNGTLRKPMFGKKKNIKRKAKNSIENRWTLLLHKSRERMRNVPSKMFLQMF